MVKSFKNIPSWDLFPEEVDHEYPVNGISCALLWPSWAFYEEKCLYLWMSWLSKPEKRQRIASPSQQTFQGFFIQRLQFFRYWGGIRNKPNCFEQRTKALWYICTWKFFLWSWAWKYSLHSKTLWRIRLKILLVSVTSLQRSNEIDDNRCSYERKIIFSQSRQFFLEYAWVWRYEEYWWPHFHIILRQSQ